MKTSTLCPNCEKPTRLDENNLYRPFCSERCKLIDLGQWADESYKIPEPNFPDLDSKKPTIKH